MNEAHQTKISDRAAPGERTWRDTFHALSLLVIAPTAALFAASYIVGSMVPWLNLDILIVYVISIFLARRSRLFGISAAVIGLSIVIYMQLFMSVGLIYIENPTLILDYVRFIDQWPWRLIIQYALIFFALIIVLAFIMSKSKLQNARSWPGVLIFVSAMCLDVASRTPAGYQLLGTNVATSSLVRGAKLLMTWIDPPPFSAGDFGSPTAKDLVKESPPQARILTVSVESLGHSIDDGFNKFINTGIQSKLSAYYDIKIDTHQYKGATLAGELRELCSLKVTGSPSRSEALKLRDNCLPKELSDLGYHTLGIHGNSRFFYNRSEVYKAIGFEKTLFFDDLKSSGAAVCKTRAFNGVCDREAFNIALEFLGGHPRAFAHVMTLDTHFPLSAKFAGDAVCEDQSLSQELCIYRHQFARFMTEFGATIASSHIKPDVIYVFGDHAPPFVGARDRYFFDRKRVPFITLTLRPSESRKLAAAESAP